MRRTFLGLLTLGLLLFVAACGGKQVSATQVATASGATSCDESSFYVQSQLTGHKDAIYDCRFGTKLPKCVSYDANIAHDVTGEVQLLFADAINSQRPNCLTWLKQAKAKRAKIAARKAEARRLAKQRAWEKALAQDAQAPWHAGYSADFTGVGQYHLPNVYYKWVTAQSCADFAENGCWKVEVVTRNGCPSDLTVEIEEIAAGTQVGSVSGYSGALAPETPAIVEVDADQSQTSQGRVGSIGCY